VAATVAVMLVDVSPAAAQDTEEKKEFDDTVHVVQRKPMLQKNRLEIAPRFGTSLNDPIYRSFKAGANLNFHISERAYIGGLFEWYNFGDALGGRTSAFEKSYDQTSTQADAPVLNWFGGLEGGFKPIYGKFALFNSAIMYYDLGASIGVGYADATSINRPSSSGTFGATASLSGRLFLNDWMAFDLELRDIFYPTKLSSGGQRQNVLANSVTFSGGVSLYLPTTFEYSSEGSQ
jgi:outer membrane beta-barrel protein